MLFYSFFKTLVGKEVVVELKNDLEIKGTLHSVDQYLNVKLENVQPQKVGPLFLLQYAATYSSNLFFAFG